ncbi:metallophosphoesterase [Paraconexibacter sp.]|uniref:metallophosphoesterase n=1 Tax=Paraconexibacter sp. TaxID=2949640 RepID=UPI00356B399F
MRTLVISDLHLGSRLERDVLRRPAALEALLHHIERTDRLVLLGDIVEMLEGRPRAAFEDARGVLQAIGQAVGPDREIIVVPGNHDHRLVRRWVRAQAGRGRPVKLASRVPVSSSPVLSSLVRALRPAPVHVHYPGFWLADGVYAHHGHYVDRELLLARSAPSSPSIGRPGPKPPYPSRGDQRIEDYERGLGASFAAIQVALGSTLPRGVSAAIDRAASVARTAGMIAAPALDAALPSPVLAPFSAGLLGQQFRRSGLPAMATVAGRLGVDAKTVVFGHLHRAGPLSDDPRGEWTPLRGGPRLLNTGCWVYEPLLLAGAGPGHPYWPGGAVRVDARGRARTVNLLDAVDPADLR